MRSLVAAVGILALAHGCSDDKPTGRLTIEIAESNDPDCREATSAAPPFQCALISVCQRVPGSATCVPVQATTGGDVSVDGSGPLGTAVLTKITDSKNFEVQLRLHDEGDEMPNLEGTELEVTTVLYDDRGNPTHQAIRTRMTPAEFLSEPQRVRAYKYGVASCAGPNDAGANPDSRRFVERAFHQATRLPNGDVLVYGGIKEGARPTDLDGIGALPQPIVEVYRVQEGRIDVLAGSFSRTLFKGTLLTADPNANVYRIYVSGGVDSLGSPLGFDWTQNQANNYYGSPVVMSAAAMVQPDVILSYDRQTGVVSVAPAATTETFGAVAADDLSDAALLPVVAGATVAPAGATPWTFDVTNLWIDRETGAEAAGAMAMRSVGNAQRFGHTVTLLGAADDYAFTWGGNINTGSLAEVSLLAGQVIALGGAVRDVAAPEISAGVTFAPAAFHSATRLGADDVLVIGGMETGCVTGAGCQSVGVTPLPSRRPIARLSMSSTGIEGVTPLPLPCGYESTFFHSAVPMDDDSLLLTGGSTCDAAAMTGACAAGTHFQASREIYRVGLDTVTNAAGDDVPDQMLQARFAHRVTPLSTCPAGAADCADPRYLVTGGMHLRTAGGSMTLETMAHGEVLFVQRTSAFGRLHFDTNCKLLETDAGVDAGPPDSGTLDSGCFMDSEVPPVMDAGTDSGMDGAADGAIDAPADVPAG